MQRSPSQSESTESAQITDRELILRFAGRGDQAAFRTLVDRHGALVFRVCRGILRHHQDAQDAFQATFLVLARKAGKVRWQTSLVNWLYGTARRIALKANARLHKEQRQAMADDPETIDVFEHVAARDAERTLHEELDQLPEQLRAPLILCYLEGKTQNQAAADLGVPPSTINGRLQRGRLRLRVQLARRGIGLAFPAAVVGQTLSIQPAGAASLTSTSLMALPEPLVNGTVQAATEFASSLGPSGAASAQALTLAKGDLAMFTSATAMKLTTATAALLAVLGVSWLLLLSDASAKGPESLLPFEAQLVGEPTGAQPPPTEIAAEDPSNSPAADSDVEFHEMDSILVVFSTKANVISVFSAHTGKWHKQSYEPFEGEEVAHLLFGGRRGSDEASHVVFHAGNRAYGFSGSKGTWQSIELPEGAEVRGAILRHNELAFFQAGNRVYGFSGRTGTWDSFEVPKGMRLTRPTSADSYVYVKVGDTWYAFSSLAPDPKWVAMDLERAAEGDESSDD